MNAPLGLVDRAAARARYDAALIEQATAVEIAAWKAAAWLRDYRFLVERYSPADLVAYDTLVAHLVDATETKPRQTKAAHDAWRAASGRHPREVRS